MGEAYDCMIIGGGPAGLVAATYLGRFRRRVLIWDAGESRAQWIPLTHNTPGFPDGVSGPDLLSRLREQTLEYGAELREEHVRRLEQGADGFEAESPASSATAPIVLFAAGVRNEPPPLENPEAAVRSGLLRYCPICDGYESSGKRIALYGDSDAIFREADFLSTYSDDITLFPASAESAGAWRGKHGYTLQSVPRSISIENDHVAVDTGAERHSFDTLYGCLGCRPVSGLAAALGASLSKTGGVLVDAHMRTNVPGFYAIGDVVEGLDQIAVGFGHAAIAAVDAHNALRARDRVASAPNAQRSEAQAPGIHP